MNDQADEVSKVRRTTELEVKFGSAGIVLQIWGPTSRRKRRALALAIHERIKPLFGVNPEDREKNENGWIAHGDLDGLNWYKSVLRGLSLRQAQSTETPEQQLGYEIRMKRLDLGWSQQELAKRSGVQRTHLSRIEHGRLRVLPQTVERILQALTPHIDAQSHKGAHPDDSQDPVKET
jgi:DNA-binding XRE family transcriptional regulator